MGVTPGIVVKTMRNSLAEGRIKEKQSGNASGQLFQAGAAGANDITDISGISPNQMGFPESSRESWLKLSYAQKKASQKLLSALWGCEGNWKIFWLQFAPKTRKG